jgi:type I restriction enzyme S subunit
MGEQNELPQLPKGWIATTLGEIAIVMDVDHKMPKAVDKGIVFLSPKDFVDRDGIDITDAKRISEEDYQRLCKKIKPGKGDILYTRIGTIGKVRRVPEN